MIGITASASPPRESAVVRLRLIHGPWVTQRLYCEKSERLVASASACDALNSWIVTVTGSNPQPMSSGTTDGDATLNLDKLAFPRKQIANVTAFLRNMTKSNAPTPLTANEIGSRLKALPKNVVEEIFQLTKAQVDAEMARQSRLDAKATSLLAAVGLSLTVAFTFGGLLLGSNARLNLAVRFHRVLPLAFGFALLCGIVAAIVALIALRVQAQKAVNEDSLFNVNVLDKVRERTRTLDATDTNPRDAASDRAMQGFMVSMTIHLWTIVQESRKKHVGKANMVRWGQLAFAAFLTTLAVVFGFVAYGIYIAPP